MSRIVRVDEAPVTRQRRAKSLDDQLAGHLQNAEHHLIEAAKLFEQDPKLRPKHYKDRLERSQEITTSLYGEELIRIRDEKYKKRKKK